MKLNTTFARTLGYTAAALALSAPAFADGTHSHNALATLIHWLSSPAHSLFTVIGVVACIGLLAAAKRRKQA